MNTEDLSIKLTYDGVIITDRKNKITFTTKNKRLIKGLKIKNINVIIREIEKIYDGLEFFGGTAEDLSYDRALHNDIKKATGFNLEKGIREFTLGIVKYLEKVCAEENPNSEKIRYLGSWLWDIGENRDILSSYVKTIFLVKDGYSLKENVDEQVQKLSRTKSKLLNNIEKKVILDIGRSLVLEFDQLELGKKPDFGSIKIHASFLYKVLSQNVLKGSNFPSWIKFHISINDTLIGWEFEQELLLSKNLHRPIYIEFVSHDDMGNQFEIISTKYGYLNEESQRKLATAIFQEKRIRKEKSNHLISYSGNVMELLSVVEKELRDIINSIEKSNKKLMWKQIYVYLNENPFLDSLFTWEWTNFINDFEKMNLIRNRAAHGETISWEEFLNVKKFVLEGPILHWISEFKAVNNK
ncbi:hypothetical protein ABIC37_005067 [Priestia megaterium]|uniref:hypothetical protein n=1 Tax=Priestia megaterium TaxID=1404 RepID=UPI003396B6D4